MTAKKTEILIIGAGLIGLSTAMHIKRMRPRSTVTVIEKGSVISDQQSGHNSGVLHAGIYYEPGSLKAQFCVEGNQQLAKLCLDYGLPLVRCGKVIVAGTGLEEARLDWLLDRGAANGVPGLRIIGESELREIEPNVHTSKALYAPNSAIVDYRKIAAAYADLFEKAGGELKLNTEFIRSSIEKGVWRVISSADEYDAELIINCAGLQSDIVAAKMGCQPDVKIIPFRGEYYLLKAESRELVNGLVYPVPDPSLPFLDVHLTPRVNGDVEAGPNAVLATRREGYTWGDFFWPEFRDTLRYPGFWKLASRHFRAGVSEINRSLRKSVFVRSLQKLVPDIMGDDLVPGGAGVRALAVDRDGRLIDDFYLEEMPGAIHVLNAPSPAATSSFLIGKHVANRANLRINDD